MADNTWHRTLCGIGVSEWDGKGGDPAPRDCGQCADAPQPAASEAALLDDVFDWLAREYYDWLEWVEQPGRDIENPVYHDFAKAKARFLAARRERLAALEAVAAAARSVRHCLSHTIALEEALVALDALDGGRTDG